MKEKDNLILVRKIMNLFWLKNLNSKKILSVKFYIFC